MNLEQFNLHWKEKFFYDFPTERFIFKKLAKNFDNKQIISISGLRRTGKTILIKQLIDYLIKVKSVKRDHIFYFSFDESQPTIEELLTNFQKIKNLDISNTKIYVFFDEIQKLENWQNQLKVYYDQFDIKFFVSGSSSLFISKLTTESLAGRNFDFYLPPLTFKEFLIFNGKEELTKKQNSFPGEIKKEFELFLKRQLIDLIDFNEENISDYIRNIIEKIIYVDIPKVFPVENKELLLRLANIIASNPGMIIEYESLSKELGINRVTLSNYLFYLEKAYLIKKIYNFSKNMMTSEKKSKKFYLSSTSFSPYLSPNADTSKLVENFVITESNAKFFWRTPQKDEVDVVLADYKKDKILPIEVKYKNSIAKKDLRSLTKFCLKFKITNALILTKDLEEIRIKTKDKKKIKIKFLPVWKWALQN